MLLFVQILGFLGGLVVVIIVMSELDDAFYRKKIIKQVREERELQAAKEAKDAPILDALEDPELIELGGPRKELLGDEIEDPFRGAQ